MEENNRKGPGMFYAVVGVATLVVAIIGATFAFFTATADTNTNITGQTTTAASVALKVTPVRPTEEALQSDSGRMVPLKESLVTTAFKDKGCVDSNGYVACQVYQIEVTNGSETEAVLSTTKLKLDNSKITDLRWQVMSDPTTLSGTNVIGDEEGEHAEASDVAEKQTIPAGETVTYYVGIWMHDNEATEGQNAQAGQRFTGTVSANVVNADGSTASQVTATFK